jgi:hypothetical protein
LAAFTVSASADIDASGERARKAYALLITRLTP